MRKKTKGSGEQFNWNGVVTQIFDMIGTNTAIINRYGIILASQIPEFTQGKVISPTIWDLIIKRKKLVSELKVKNTTNLILETDQGNIIFTFGEYVYLMSKVSKNVNLSQYLPSITRIISTLDKSTEKKVKVEFISLDLKNEYKKLENEGKMEMTHERLPIFKHIIKLMSKK